MRHEHPLVRLSTSDLDLVARFVLGSGSLKKLAAEYGVSYPTIRRRLDLLIVRLQDAIRESPRDEFLELLADEVQMGEVTVQAARRLRQRYRDRIDPGR